jgi:hypothetical protein
VGITTVWVYHDLPEAVASLPIKERIGHAMMEKLVEDGIARDLNAAAYPRVTVQDSMPDYVIKSFGELTGVLNLHSRLGD